MMRDLLRACNVGYDLKGFTSLRHALEAQHLDRRSGPDFVDCFAAVIKHSAYLAKDLTHNKRIANSQCALLDQRSGHSAAAAIQFSFEHDARGQTRCAGAQIQDV